MFVERKIKQANTKILLIFDGRNKEQQRFYQNCTGCLELVELAYIFFLFQVSYVKINPVFVSFAFFAIVEQYLSKRA